MHHARLSAIALATRRAAADHIAGPEGAPGALGVTARRLRPVGVLLGVAEPLGPHGRAVRLATAAQALPGASRVTMRDRVDT